MSSDAYNTGREQLLMDLGLYKEARMPGGLLRGIRNAGRGIAGAVRGGGRAAKQVARKARPAPMAKVRGGQMGLPLGGGKPSGVPGGFRPAAGMDAPIRATATPKEWGGALAKGGPVQSRAAVVGGGAKGPAVTSVAPTAVGRESGKGALNQAGDAAAKRKGMSWKTKGLLAGGAGLAGAGAFGGYGVARHENRMDDGGWYMGDAPYDPRAQVGMPHY